jgi:hypothetical protein
VDFGDRLRALGLVSEVALEGHDPLRTDHRSLLVLTDEGLLGGGLSLALNVRPDEAVGALSLRMGGAARALKVVDVRDRPVLELKVELSGVVERWELEDVRGLVHNLNDAFAREQGVKTIAVLGDWQDALHLLFVDAPLLGRLLRERWFEPENREDLQRVLEPVG